MRPVNRYDVSLSECLIESSSPTGRWVYYSDYEELQDSAAGWEFGAKTVKKMTERIKELEDIVRSQNQIIERMKGGVLWR